MKFVNLYIETEYSMLSSTIKIKELVKKAKEYNYSSLAITDYNNVHGAIKFYSECLKNDIKPIMGLHLNKNDLDFLFYAINNDGFREILKLASLAKISDSEITIETLSKLTKNCITIIPGAENSLVNSLLFSDVDEARKIISLYKKNFENLYIGLDLQTAIMKQKIDEIIEFFALEGIECVALNKTSYLLKDDFDAYVFLKCIGKLTNDYPYTEKEMNMSFLSRLEVEAMFSKHSKLIENTKKISDKCNVILEFDKYKMPVFISEIDDKVLYLKELSMVGLNKRLRKKKVDVNKYKERLLYELEVIIKMGFVDYFLIVYDYVKYAKKQNIFVGCGRGSAPGSLVSYSLGITDIDPIEFDLLFERFLNPERTSMPDIDVDFPDDKREEVIRYMGEKYGVERVAHISTFGTYGPRMAIRDVARVMRLDEKYLNEIIKYVGNGDESISVSEKKSPILSQMIKEIPEIKKLYNIVVKIEGLPRHVSVHAAGIIMADDYLTKYTALQDGINGLYQTQFEADDLQKLGLVKFDFLGIRNLTIISSVVEKINLENENEKFSMSNIDYNDKKVYELIASGDTDGVFQLESKGMRDTLSLMKTSEFIDIVNTLALYRPGPMDMIPSFIKRKFGEEKVTYIDKTLEEILKPTYGTIVFQEQILLIAQKFAAYTLGQADILRRAVSKKNAEILENERERFVLGALKNGHSKEKSNEIYDYILKFANYGFNKSHSVAYSMIAYQMAYLKYHYYKHFMAELMSNTIGNIHLIKNYILDCNKRKIKVFLPSVNKSGKKFVATTEGIYYSLLGIQNVGSVSVEAFLKEREENGEYSSYDEFISRTKKIFNKRIVESLIYSGALDEFKIPRKQMVLEYDNSIEISNYGLILKDRLNERKFSDEELSFEEISRYEKEVLGFNLKYDIFSRYRNIRLKYATTYIRDLNLGKTEKIFFVIDSIREIKTKNNEEMAFLSLYDDTSSIEGVIFPKTYVNLKKCLKRGALYLGIGKIENRNNKKQIIFDSIVIVK